MEKLIELYYEHKLDLLKRDMRGNGATEREIELADIEKVEEDELEKNLNKLPDLKPFIKWLVENEKINREKFGNSETKSSKYSDFELSYDTPREDYTNTLLMELAIQNEPIQFLIEMLK